MSVKEIKSRYDGKCVKCGRDIKQGWTIFYDSDGKKVYCQPCGQSMAENGEGGLSKADWLIELDMIIPTVCSSCGAVIDAGVKALYDTKASKVFCEACSSIQSELANPATRNFAEIKMLLNEMANTGDLVFSHVGLSQETITAIDERLRDIEKDIAIIISRLSATKPKDKVIE